MNNQQGITLVEMALALAVAGLLMSGALAIYQQAEKQRQLETTYDNMDAIVQALSVYAESNGRIPCPADPAAQDAEAGKEKSSCDDKTREGILPYTTLGLAASIAKDGWGYYYSYAVSPVFARKNDQSALPSDTGRIHGRCRHAGWVNTSDRYNRNAIKARFCCTDQAGPTFDSDSDLIIAHTAGGKTISPVRAQGISANYDSIDKTTTISIGGADVPAMDTTPIETPAFILVSHGPNHRGAWVGNGSDKRFAPADSGPEAQNADGNQVFVDGPWSMKPGSEHFDDIVRWMTQDGLMAAHGALSCSYP